MDEIVNLIALKPLCNRGCAEFQPIYERGTHKQI